jgi:hypothetical protein
MPDYSGSCECKKWSIRVTTAALGDLNPRVCDCDYCSAHPSAVISAADMLIELFGNSDNLIADLNGDRLANFYRCKTCGALLAVGCAIGGQMRGAVNGLLLDQSGSLGATVKIQPRLLAANEKLVRWNKLWGKLEGV